MTRQASWCDVDEAEDLAPCTRQAEHVVTWVDEAEQMMTMKVCAECLESVRHSLQWDSPEVVEVLVALFAALPERVLA